MLAQEPARRNERGEHENRNGIDQALNVPEKNVRWFYRGRNGKPLRANANNQGSQV